MDDAMRDRVLRTLAFVAVLSVSLLVGMGLVLVLADAMADDPPGVAPIELVTTTTAPTATTESSVADPGPSTTIPAELTITPPPSAPPPAAPAPPTAPAPPPVAVPPPAPAPPPPPVAPTDDDDDFDDDDFDDDDFDDDDDDDDDDD